MSTREWLNNTQLRTKSYLRAVAVITKKSIAFWKYIIPTLGAEFWK
jgi:hypothetical protein